LENGNEYKESKINQIERIKKGDRLKNNLSQRIDLDSAIIILNIIAEINATMKIQKLQIEISTTQETQMKIFTAEKIQKRQNENI
jgi:hypothetical protein